MTECSSSIRWDVDKGWYHAGLRLENQKVDGNLGSWKTTRASTANNGLFKYHSHSTIASKGEK